MKICHVISMNSIDEMGIITRAIYHLCEGAHIYHYLHDPDIPEADIYILHCFKNQKHFPAFIKWKPLLNRPVISLVHSSEPCMPSRYSDEVVTITNAWHGRLYHYYGITSERIYGCVEDRQYFSVEPDYDSQAFGKITRPEAGKYHSQWNDIVKELLSENQQRKCIIASNGYKKLRYLDHPRMEWIEGIGIADIKKKRDFFSKLSVYTECHNDGGNAFIDTFCVAMLEGMASGLPVVLYKGLQKPMAEVLGDAGIICDTIDEYKNELREMLNNKAKRIEYGQKARERAKFFSVERMVSEWNKLLNRYS